MPSAPKRPCPAPGGCINLIEHHQKFCPVHLQEFNAGDRERRGSSAERGYGRRWQLYRPGWLEAHPFCGDKEPDAYPAPNGREASLCKREGRMTLADDVHHIISGIPANDPRFYDPRMHESLCSFCHKSETAKSR